MSYQSPLGRVLGSTVTLRDYLEEGFVGTQKILSAIERYVKDDGQKFPKFIRKRQARRIVTEIFKVGSFSARARKNPRWLSEAKPAVNCA
jgi:hypothetical protein